MNIGDDDLLRLRHMQDYAREVVEFTSDAKRDALDTNRVLLRAITMSIGIIGEAASQVSHEFREQHPSIPWREIIGMRNFLFHVYFMINNEILWNTATISIPELLAELDAVLPTDPDKESPS
jgi:uncharacterized protein with HEPN domain